jgi:hypothetical protein
MTKLIRYIGRATFSKQVNADFDHIANKKLLNYTYLQKLCKNIDGPKLGSALISAETSIDDLKKLPKDIKFRLTTITLNNIYIFFVKFEYKY